MADGYLYLGSIFIGRSYTKYRQYLTYTVTVAGRLVLPTSKNTGSGRNMWYRKNGGSWTQYQNGSVTTAYITVAVGDTIEIKGYALPDAMEMSGYIGFSTTDSARYNLSGNILSLLYGDDFNVMSSLPSSTAAGAFRFGGRRIVSAADLVLPITTLSAYTYQFMFSGCTYLTEAPELPATELANYCYATMFAGCTSLTKAPALPATTLNDSCYYRMFRGCTSLQQAPTLPALTLASGCYEEMFSGCTNLNYIDAAFVTIPGTNYTLNWTAGVAATGTFVKNPAATWRNRGVNGIPVGWTVEGEEPIVETSGTTFGGLEIAPGDLRYQSSAFQIMPAWNTACSYNSISGKTNGSTFFTMDNLGSYFDSAGASYNKYNDGTIDNTNKVSYGGYSDWRMPTANEILHLVGSGATRSGATISCGSGIYEGVTGILTFISGLTAMNGATVFAFPYQLGIIIPRDGAVIEITSNISVMSRPGVLMSTIVGTPGQISQTDFNHFMDMGCAFLPCNGFNNVDTGGRAWGSWHSVFWSTRFESNMTTAIALNYQSSYIPIEVDMAGNISYDSDFASAAGQCRLVRGTANLPNYVVVGYMPGMNMYWIIEVSAGWNISDLTNNPPELYLNTKSDANKVAIASWVSTGSSLIATTIDMHETYTFTPPDNPTSVTHATV